LAIKLSGGGPSTKGNEVIRGELNPKGLKKGDSFQRGWRLWTDGKGEITDGCKKIMMDDRSCVKSTLERK
jgi:hypothetical protein